MSALWREVRVHCGEKYECIVERSMSALFEARMTLVVMYAPFNGCEAIS